LRDMAAGTGRRVYAPKRQGWGRVRKAVGKSYRAKGGAGGMKRELEKDVG